MKMNPITFSERYCDRDEPHLGFKSFKNEKGEYIDSRTVTLCFTNWSGGVAIVLTITEDFFPEDAGKQTRELEKTWFYDYPRDSPQKQPTHDQILLMKAMSSGELRGRYAESIAQSLFIDLFVIEATDDNLVRRFLPDVVKFWKEFRERHG